MAEQEKCLQIVNIFHNFVLIFFCFKLAFLYLTGKGLASHIQKVVRQKTIANTTDGGIPIFLFYAMVK